MHHAESWSELDRDIISFHGKRAIIVCSACMVVEGLVVSKHPPRRTLALTRNMQPSSLRLPSLVQELEDKMQYW
jgi:hypothetical protein